MGIFILVITWKGEERPLSASRCREEIRPNHESRAWNDQK